MLPVYLPVEDIKFGGYTTVCAVCYKPLTECTLQKCSGCKLIFYCSKQHQKYHWTKHKLLCKAVQLMIKTTNNIGLFDDYVDEGFHMWTVYRESLIYICEGIMKRKMVPEEKNLFLFPLCCKVCHITNSNCMITCPNCCVISYCSENHRETDEEHHSQECNDLKFIVDFHSNCQKGFCIEGNINDVKKLPDDMHSFIDEHLFIETKPKKKENYAKCFVSNSLSIPLSMIYVIEKSEIFKNLDKDELVLHIVGCAQYENSSWWAWEYIFHYFKKLKSLNLVFIGPESSEYFLPPILSCQDCKVSKVIKFRVENSFYVQYLNKNVNTPDIIFAFNCGFHEYENKPEHDTWKNSMKSLCSFSNSVVAFTSYNKSESMRDLKILKKFCENDNLNILIGCEENPFRSLLPVQDWCYEDGNIFYNNYFINILKI